MKYVFIFLFALTAFSCSEKEQLPLKEEKLIDALGDIHLAEAAMMQLSGAEKDSLAEKYYDQVMKIHEINRADFDTCIAIMRRDPELMEEIYDKVLAALEKKKLELDKNQ